MNGFHPGVLLLSLGISVATLLLRGKAASPVVPPPSPATRGYHLADCSVVVDNLEAARPWARTLAASLPELPAWTEEAALKAWLPIAAPALFEACPQLQQPEAWDAHPALAYQLLVGLAEGLRLYHKAPQIFVAVAFTQARAAMLARGWPAALLVPEAPEVV